MILCCFPQIFLLLIEIIQMRSSGWDYINGWNLIDLIQLILFWVQFFEKCVDVLSQRDDTGFTISKLMRLMLILFSILKVVHFIAVYEQFGFFIKMVIICLWDLVPFISNYILFLNFFVIVYASLGVEIHEELDLQEDDHAGMKYIGYYGMLLLTVYRNSVGKLGYAKYQAIIDANRADLLPHTFTIWIAYFFQILITLVIGLNLMIGIIESTYQIQNELKEAKLYINKAELNQECAEILKYFITQREFRIIIFTKFDMVKNDTQSRAQEVVHGKEDETDILVKSLEEGVEVYCGSITEKQAVVERLDHL